MGPQIIGYKSEMDLLQITRKKLIPGEILQNSTATNPLKIS